MTQSQPPKADPFAALARTPDVSSFKPRVPEKSPERVVRAVSEAHGFSSRVGPKGEVVDGRQPVQVRMVWRRQRVTGRNVPTNIKSTQAVLDRFHALCDKHKVEAMGEMFELLVENQEKRDAEMESSN
jgi:hypothetical protein